MTQIAHISGVPLEELLVLAAGSGGAALVAARAWLSGAARRLRRR